jgi:hypothetical protein
VEGENGGVVEGDNGGVVEGEDVTPNEGATTMDEPTDAVPQANASTVEPLSGAAAAPMSHLAAPEDLFVYAIGLVEHRYPTLGVEKELAQAMGRAEPNGLADQRAVYETLKQHAYLARKMCYVMVIGGLETYLLQPRDRADFELLVEAVRPSSSPGDLDAVIGVRGPIAPPDMCNGLMIPIVTFDQLYSFDHGSLRESIPRPEHIAADDFAEATDNVLRRILQMTDNAGATDEDRALNYLALRYERIYRATAEAHGRNASLSSIEVRRAPVTSGRTLMDVIFAFTDRQTDVTDKLAVRVDVTEMFPFLVTKLSPYVDRLS